MIWRSLSYVCHIRSTAALTNHGTRARKVQLRPVQTGIMSVLSTSSTSMYRVSPKIDDACHKKRGTETHGHRIQSQAVLTGMKERYEHTREFSR
jgi:hypothetical protein